MQFDERKVARYPLVNSAHMPPRVSWQYYPRPGHTNPSVRMGMYSVKTHVTRWINGVAGNSHTYLSRIGWQAGHSHRAYAVVLNRAQTRLNVVTVDAQHEQPRLLLNLVNPYWVNVTANPRFLPDGRFIMATFKSVWKQLYLYSYEGKKIRNLTPGAFNVQFFAGLGQAGKMVYFTAGPKGGPQHTDLYRIPLAGGARERVTDGHGTHRVYLGPSGAHFLDFQSDAITPTSVTLRAITGQALVTVQAAPSFKYPLLKPRFFKIPAADGKTKLTARIMTPPDFDPEKKYPVVMYQYGGPHNYSVARNVWQGCDALFNQLLAHRGFIVFAADNRAAGYFSHTAQAQVKFKLGQIALADQLAALNWLKAQPYVADNRIGIWGWSFGGYMTAYELTHAPDAWAAGIAIAPVVRWQDYDSIYTERYMGPPKDNAKGYKASSVLAAADRLKAPLLLVAGTGDDNVHWQNTLAFISALVAYNKPYQLKLYPNKTHAIPGADAKVHLYSAMLAFWSRHLTGGDDD